MSAIPEIPMHLVPAISGTQMAASSVEAAAAPLEDWIGWIGPGVYDRITFISGASAPFREVDARSLLDRTE